MTTYNPFTDFNEDVFTKYKYLKPQKVELKDSLDNVMDVSSWASDILPNGNIIASPNTPEAARAFDTSFLDKNAETHSEPSQEIIYTTKQDLQGNKKRAMEFFQSKGLSAHQAAGIVGNLIVESAGLNTTIKGDGGKAFGLAQWHPDRQKGLKALAQKRGTDISDFDTQLEYVWEELNSPGYKLALNGILNSRNAKEATTAFMKHFEKPGIPHFEKRLKEAESLLS